MQKRSYHSTRNVTMLGEDDDFIKDLFDSAPKSGAGSSSSSNDNGTTTTTTTTKTTTVVEEFHNGRLFTPEKTLLVPDKSGKGAILAAADIATAAAADETYRHLNDPDGLPFAMRQSVNEFSTSDAGRAAGEDVYNNYADNDAAQIARGVADDAPEPEKQSLWGKWFGGSK